MQEKSVIFRKRKGLAVLLVILLTPSTGFCKVIDKIAAVVNDDIIMMSELDAETDRRYKAAIGSGDNEMLTSVEVIKEQTLNSLIDLALIRQKAAKMNVTVSEKEIDRIFELNLASSGVSREIFLDEMKKAGFTEEQYRQNLQTSLLQSKIVSREVHSKIVITDKMIEDYYLKNYPTETTDNKVYKLLQMGFTWGVGAQNKEKGKAREIAQKIRDQVVSGKDFKELARQHSTLPSATDGGDIGNFTLEDMNNEMANAIKDLKPGETSEIIETADGFQFFQLVSLKKETISTEDRMKDVKDEIQEKLFQERLRSAYSKWVRELKENAYIRKLP